MEVSITIIKDRIFLNHNHVVCLTLVKLLFIDSLCFLSCYVSIQIDTRPI